eukprot:CAMPEP_0171454236 /NCGR_PEP_ID=MMETSP0945-20130129/1606_1 /TAXON_ID=109269 /ORGANISM="Vaucheria litorea, Strain CCMP2940" /LENGTH=89 /DNA_ID=CAMNT_0011979225 /DNA_START=118 /DNA_END=384 /DNA_ORIENTATION=-
MSSMNLDKDIVIGSIDDKIKESIREPLRVLGNAAELIDTKNEVCTFKYNGPIKHKFGMESYARMMITETCSNIKDVKFVTNRVRDPLDY